MKTFLFEAEPGKCWRVESQARTAKSRVGLCQQRGQFLRATGKGISCPSRERKQRGSWLMCWTCGAIPAGQRLLASKELSSRNGAERVEIGAAGSIFIIQTEILIMRIGNKVFELLWVDTLFWEAPLSLPAQVPVGQSQTIGLSWVKSREF